MQITDLLSNIGGIQAIARELGVSESQAASGADALLPAILGGFKKQAQASGGAGAGGFGDLLGQLGGGGLLDSVLSPQPTDIGRGNDVLGQIFGSKDVSRTVANEASSRSGLDPALLKKMLPMIAMVVAGLMAKQRQSGGASMPGGLPTGGGGGGGVGGGGLGDLLGGILGGGQRGAGQAAGAGAGGLGGLGGLGALLDQDGDGNPLDDILRMAGKSLR